MFWYLVSSLRTIELLHAVRHAANDTCGSARASRSRTHKPLGTHGEMKVQ